MGSSIRFTNLTRATTIKETAAAAALRPEVTKVVDLEATKTKATIVRGTESVETPVINPVRATGILDSFIPIRRTEEARSVKQSIAAGTLVARGTAVDLEFLAPANVSLGLFEGVHADLRTRNVLAVAPLLDDPEVVTLVKKDVGTLTVDERQNLSVKLAAQGVTVDETNPDRSLGAAVMGLKSAQAFR
jgi:hypothetical protein